MANTTVAVSTHYHPHVCDWIKALNRLGIPGLLTLSNQQLTDPKPPDTVFEKTYAPNTVELAFQPFPREDVDFSSSGSYSLYNWELFFHVPMLIANRLGQNQRFEEAMNWFHYMFNPTVANDPKDYTAERQRFWKFLPFHNNTNPEKEQIREILWTLSSKDAPGRAELEKAVQEWRANPFKPHLVARSRITAYQKNVAMKYIDNLIAWGDQLFRRDTIETINEATQLYIVAYHILGQRPERIAARGKVQARSYAELRQETLDQFSNITVALENDFLYATTPPPTSNGGSGATTGLSSIAETLYFGIPQNQNLLGYWDTVEDRLFKIRNCMNIGGVVRGLPLFEPPIDPALLVRAVAMGVDLSSVLNDMTAPLPPYRFGYMLQKALELCGELRSLGAALLSALEKKDAERLAVLRSSHELSLLDAVRTVKDLQASETNELLEGLRKSREVVNIRHEHYGNLEFMNPWEVLQLVLSGVALVSFGVGAALEPAAGAAHAMPDEEVGTSGHGPHLVQRHGGSHVGSASEAWARTLKDISSLSNMAASMAATLGGHTRRKEDWDLQKKLAAKELEQVDRQIAAAQIRVDIAGAQRQLVLCTDDSYSCADCPPAGGS